MDRKKDRPGGRRLHLAKTGLPPCQDHDSQVAAEGRDGPAGQSAVGTDQEAGHGPAGREGEEGPRQRGALRNTRATVIEAVHCHSLDFTVFPLLYHTCEL